MYKYGTIYREVMHTPVIDWCKIMKEATDSILIAQLMLLFNANAPGIWHKCPLTVKLKLYCLLHFDNILGFCPQLGLMMKHAPFKTSALMSIFPSGDYKMNVTTFSSKGEPYYNIAFVASINSPLKESFGR